MNDGCRLKRRLKCLPFMLINISTAGWLLFWLSWSGGSWSPLSLLALSEQRYTIRLSGAAGFRVVKLFTPGQHGLQELAVTILSRTEIYPPLLPSLCKEN